MTNIKKMRGEVAAVNRERGPTDPSRGGQQVAARSGSRDGNRSRRTGMTQLPVPEPRLHSSLLRVHIERAWPARHGPISAHGPTQLGEQGRRSEARAVPVVLGPAVSCSET